LISCAQVLVSSVGVVAAGVGLCVWASRVGALKVALLYGAPLVVVNAWLVLYTWLQHTGERTARKQQEQH
jgi:omega-6 fatty acid desaturase (delta-12 desaturase)